METATLGNFDCTSGGVKLMQGKSWPEGTKGEKEVGGA